MHETWRWFGPLDDINLGEITQTGASGIVTALHDIPYGEVWNRDQIAQRKAEIEQTGFLNWAVVESLPVHEDIKRGAGDLTALFDAYRQSIQNLAAEGISTICYNFMPLLDWTRTDLAAPLPRGGTTLRFDIVKMAAFDRFMLGREAAESDYSAQVLEAAERWHAQSDDDTRNALLTAIMSGLPGAYTRFSIEGLQDALKAWDGFGPEDLRANFKRFLEEVIPCAEAHGVKLCVHPDAPPRPLLGLPRIVSTEDDIAMVLGMVDSQSNGLTLCSGSLGAHRGNDPVRIFERFADRVHFAHLRNVTKEPNGSFYEAEHLGGDTDMVALVKAILTEERRRKAHGRTDWQIPFRPDHGHALLSDAGRKTHPGYPLIGRLRGLAELRGLVAALG